jgi:hypothetical protein
MGKSVTYVSGTLLPMCRAAHHKLRAAHNRAALSTVRELSGLIDSANKGINKL